MQRHLHTQQTGVLANDGEAQTGALFERFASRPLHPSLGELLHLTRRNARPVVAHRQDHRLWRIHHGHRDVAVALWRTAIAQGVVQQIVERPLDQGGTAHHVHRLLDPARTQVHPGGIGAR